MGKVVNLSWETSKFLTALQPEALMNTRGQVDFFCALMAQDTVTVKPEGHSKKDQKLVFQTNYCLMQVKRIAECSK